MSSSVTYREYPPSPRLAPWVACYWMLTAGSAHADPVPNRILPDGCADIILDMTGGAGVRSDTALAELPFVVGAMRTASLHTVIPGTALLGVRFRPGGAYPFLRVPLAELTDLQVGLDDLWREMAGELRERVLAAAVTAERIGTVERLLLGRLERSEAGADRVVIGAIGAIDAAHGAITVNELERTLGVGRRTLERRFAERVGIPPKLYCRIARLRRLLPAIDGDAREPDWMAMVVRGGYYDQSHLIAEVKGLTGLSPTAFRAERLLFRSADEPAPADHDASRDPR